MKVSVTNKPSIDIQIRVPGVEPKVEIGGVDFRFTKYLLLELIGGQPIRILVGTREPLTFKEKIALWLVRNR